MLQQLINTILKPQSKILIRILNDIDTLYDCIRKNGEIDNETHFKHLFTYKYWNYLRYYPRLSVEDQNKLIIGCLNFILFLNQQYINNKGTYIIKHYDEINRALNAFSPVAETHIKLQYMAKEAMILSWKKMNKMNFGESQSAIYHSISWTLKNTILNNENPPEKINNQR